jgi:hypothetical protein
MPGVVENIRYAISRCPACSEMLSVKRTPRISGHCSSAQGQFARSKPGAVSSELDLGARTTIGIFSGNFGHRVTNLISYAVGRLGAQSLEEFLSDGIGLLLG